MKEYHPTHSNVGRPSACMREDGNKSTVSAHL